MINHLSDLKGHWQFTREVRHAHGGIDLVDGSAGFSKTAQGYDYNEVGVLRVGAQEFRAERHYKWREEGGRVKVYFDDGRFFHDFTFFQPKAAHNCLPDLYKVRYIFENVTWTSRWEVNGPRKNYVMITNYTR